MLNRGAPLDVALESAAVAATLALLLRSNQYPPEPLFKLPEYYGCQQVALARNALSYFLPVPAVALEAAFSIPTVNAVQCAAGRPRHPPRRKMHGRVVPKREELIQECGSRFLEAGAGNTHI